MKIPKLSIFNLFHNRSERRAADAASIKVSEEKARKEIVDYAVAISARMLSGASIIVNIDNQSIIITKPAMAEAISVKTEPAKPKDGL